MTIDEIFSKLATHMREGLLYHNEISKAYNFLGLYGFSKCHAYHYLEENRSYCALNHYYSTHYHKLIKEENINIPNIIPNVWYNYSTMEVDASTIKKSVKELMETWINWEKETKQLYESMRQELMSISEHSAALEIDKYIIDVTEELKHAEKKFIKLETISYDLITITDWQQPIYKKYKKIIGK